MKWRQKLSRFWASPWAPHSETQNPEPEGAVSARGARTADKMEDPSKKVEDINLLCISVQ